MSCVQIEFQKKTGPDHDIPDVILTFHENTSYLINCIKILDRTTVSNRCKYLLITRYESGQLTRGLDWNNIITPHIHAEYINSPDDIYFDIKPPNFHFSDNYTAGTLVHKWYNHIGFFWLFCI